MRDLLDRLPLVIASEIDRDAKITWLNRAAVTANGCAPADVVSLLVTDVWPDVAQAEPLWRAAWDTGVEQHTTHCVRLLNGPPRWLATTFAPRAGRRLVTASVEVTAAVQLAATLAVTGIRAGATGPAPTTAAKLLLAGYDATDVATVLNVPFPHALAMCSTMAGIPRR